jgi:hypothetical protein
MPRSEKIHQGPKCQISRPTSQIVKDAGLGRVSLLVAHSGSLCVFGKSATIRGETQTYDKLGSLLLAHAFLPALFKDSHGR